MACLVPDLVYNFQIRYWTAVKVKKNKKALGSKSGRESSSCHNENKFEDAKAVISSCNLLECKLMCCGGGNNQIGYKKLNMSMIICDWHFLSLTSHDGDRQTLVSCHFLHCSLRALIALCLKFYQTTSAFHKNSLF